jgi:molybdopterin synthase sulfur carrier subunit
VSAVRIPPTLRAATAGEKHVSVAGATVGEIVAGLVTAYPDLSPQLLDAEGALNRFVNVFLNDTDIRHLDGLATLVVETDQLLLLPAMAGG